LNKFLYNNVDVIEKYKNLYYNYYIVDVVEKDKLDLLGLL